MRELDSLRQFTIKLMGRLDQVLSIGGVAVGSLFIFGIGRDGGEPILVVLPFLLFGIVFYTMNLMTDLMAVGGSIAHIERQLNRLLGKKVCVHEEVTKQTLHRALALKTVFALYAALLLVSSIVGVSTLVNSSALANRRLLLFPDLPLSLLMGVGMSVILVGLLCWAVVCYKEGNGKYEEVRRVSGKVSEEPLDQLPQAQPEAPLEGVPTEPRT